MELLEEPPGLGGQAVLAAGQAVEAVELPEGLRGGLEANLDAFLLGLLDVSPGGVAQALEELLVARGQIEGVAIEPGRGGAVAEKISSSAQLDVFPLPFPAFLNDRFEQHFRDFDMRHEGLAVIRERQADGPLAGQEAADFHQGDGGRQVPLRLREVDRREAVGFFQDIRPGGCHGRRRLRGGQRSRSSQSAISCGVDDFHRAVMFISCLFLSGERDAIRVCPVCPVKRRRLVISRSK